MSNVKSRELSQSALKLDGNLWQTRNGKVAYDALQQHYITHNVANVGKIVKTEINQEKSRMRLAGCCKYYARVVKCARLPPGQLP